MQWLDIHFPEFTAVFGDSEGKEAMITLSSFQLLSMILELGEAKGLEAWKKEN
ncbi:hypothetical protein [Acetivibrio cellulolyticus]